MGLRCPGCVPGRYAGDVEDMEAELQRVQELLGGLPGGAPAASAGAATQVQGPRAAAGPGGPVQHTAGGGAAAMHASPPVKPRGWCGCLPCGRPKG
jgi:hypothetical protein